MLKPNVVSPYRDSELALLIGNRFAHNNAVKKKILDGESELDLKLFENILSAVPTDQTVRNAKFDAMVTP